MRKLIVSNMMSLDGYYEGPDRDLGALFAYFNPAYAGDDRFDQVNTERLRAADTVLFSGRESFLANYGYWTGVPRDPSISAIRHEFADLLQRVEKIVVSDTLTPDEFGTWQNTRIIRRDDAQREIAALKQTPGREIFLYAGRTLWTHLMKADLVDELHLMIFPMVAGAGLPLFEGQPGVDLTLLSSRTWQGSGNILACYSVSRRP